MTTQPATPPPRTERNITGFILSLIAGILILFIGIVITGYSMTYHPSSVWWSFNPDPTMFVPIWLKGTNPTLIGAVEAILGLTIILGATLIFTPKTQRIGGSLVTTASIISIILVNPFWMIVISSIIGLIGGIQSLTKKQPHTPNTVSPSHTSPSTLAAAPAS